jgi:hypothetical protein
MYIYKHLYYQEYKFTLKTKIFKSNSLANFMQNSQVVHDTSRVKIDQDERRRYRQMKSHCTEEAPTRASPYVNPKLTKLMEKKLQELAKAKGPMKCRVSVRYRSEGKYAVTISRNGTSKEITYNCWLQLGAARGLVQKSVELLKGKIGGLDLQLLS